MYFKNWSINQTWLFCHQLYLINIRTDDKSWLIHILIISQDNLFLLMICIANLPGQDGKSWRREKAQRSCKQRWWQYSPNRILIINNILLYSYQLSVLLCQAYFYIFLSFRYIITKPYSWKCDKAKVNHIEEVPLLGLDEHECPWSGFHLNFVWFLFIGHLQIG